MATSTSGRKPCRAYPHSPHPATHRNGFCDQHYNEYERAMKRYHSAVYNFKRNRTPKKPPTKAAFIRTIQFSEPGIQWRRIKRDDKDALLALVAALNRDTEFLSRLYEDKDGFLEMRWSDWEMDVAALTRTVNRVSATLLELIGEEGR